MAEQIFSSFYPIHFFNADSEGRLKVESLLDFIQATAGYHYEHNEVSYEEMKARQEYWVAARLSIELDDLPKWHGEVEVRTWGRMPQGLAALREYQLYQEGRLFGKGTSTWVILKGENRRPQKPLPFCQSFLPEPNLPVLAAIAPLVEIPKEPGEVLAVFCPSYGDIDANGHGNNVRTLSWCWDRLPYEFQQRWQVKALDVNYGAEIFPTDKLELRFWEKPITQGDMAERYFQVLKVNEEKEALRARVVFRRR